MKKFKWTYLFALIVMLLIGFTVFDLQKSDRDSDRKERESKVVGLELEALTAVEISSLGATDQEAANVRRLEKRDGLWYVTLPYQDSADQQAVATLLEGIEAEKILETVSDQPANLAQFGLEKPLMTLKLEAGTESEVLTLGTVKAYDGSLYGKMQNKVVLLSSAWSVYLSKPARELRDKRVFRSDAASKVAGLKLKGRIDNRMVDIEMKRDEKGAWRSITEPSRSLSEKAVDAYVEEVKALRAFDFTTSSAVELKKKNANQPNFAIELKLEQTPKPFRLTIFTGAKKTDPNIEALSSDLDLGVLVYRPAADTLMRPPEHFYDRQGPFRFAVNDVEKIEVVAPRLEPRINVVFEKKDAVWRQMGLQTAADSTKLNQLLERLSRLEAVRFLPVNAVSRAGMSMDSKLRLLKADGTLLFEMVWGDTVTEKAQGDKPEAILLPVFTSVSKEPVAIAEGSVKDLDLENLTK